MAKHLSFDDAVILLKELCGQNGAWVEFLGDRGNCDMQYRTLKGVEFTIFNDAGDMDYLDEMTYQGQTGDFDSWLEEKRQVEGHDRIRNPLDELTEEETKTLAIVLDWKELCGYG